MEQETQERKVTLEDAEGWTVLRCEVGSTVHGLGVAGTDDRDEIGVCVEPPQYIVGTRNFEQVVHRTKPEGVRSQAGDLDLTIFGMRKFARLALKGNPSILLVFMVPDDKCMVLTETGRALRDLAPAFASKRAGDAFLGYMIRQRERMMGLRGQLRVKRPELIEQYGFDTKYAGHMLRLGFQGVEYMQKARFTIPMRKGDRNLILDVRQGKLEYHEVLDLAAEVEDELRLAIEETELPDHPDYAAVNEFLAVHYPKVWAERD